MWIKTALYAAIFAAGWFVNDWRRDSIDLAAQEKRDSDVRAAQERADAAELKAASVRAQVKIKEKVVTRDVIKYVQDPNRAVCEYDPERVRIKTGILEAVDPRSHAAD